MHQSGLSGLAVRLLQGFSSIQRNHIEEAGFVCADEEFLVFFVVSAMIGEGGDPVGNLPADILLIEAGPMIPLGWQLRDWRSVLCFQGRI